LLLAQKAAAWRTPVMSRVMAMYTREKKRMRMLYGLMLSVPTTWYHGGQIIELKECWSPLRLPKRLT
jgi:hypothetical protein